MFKNVASQTVTLYAVDTATGAPKTGDSANMVFYVSKDDGALAAVTASSGVPTEVDSTNGKGLYKIALSQSETNADKLLFSGKSSTSGVYVMPAVIYTTPAKFSTLSIDASGRALADVDTIKTQTVTCSAGVTVGPYVGNATAALSVDSSGRAKADLDTIKTQTVTCAAGVTVAAYVGTAAASTAQTGDAYARLGSPATASIAGDIAAVKTDTASIVTAVSGDPTDAIDSGTAQAGGSTSITLKAGAPSSLGVGSGFSTVVILSGTGKGQVRRVTAYNGTTKVATVTPAWATNPDNTSHYAVYNAGEYAVTDTSGYVSLAQSFPSNFSSLVISPGGLVSINTAQTLSAARAVDTVADTSLTLNDAFHCAIQVSAGQETVSGLSYVKKTPYTGTTIRTLTLDSASVPTSRT